MQYMQNPTLDYRKVDAIETEDAVAFATRIAQASPETPVAWYSHKDEKAHTGVWMCRGFYRLKHGSFVDPSDLSAYAAQYYELASTGRHECVQIGRTPETMAAPDDVIPVTTAADFITAICTLAELSDFGEQDISDEIAANSESLQQDVVEDDTTLDDAVVEGAPLAPALKLLQPDYAFEFHGALTRGWHAQFYEAETEEDSTEYLIVLR